MDLFGLTFEGALNELIAFARSKMDLAAVFGLIGAAFFVATLYAKTMVNLRLANIVSSFFFMMYGYLAPALPTFLMYLGLLPINLVRLVQLRGLIRKVRTSAQGDLSMDWLKPFMKRRRFKTGDVLFRKGDRAIEMFYTVSGRFLVSELGVELPPGRLMGELGFLTPDSRRTQSIECIEDGEVLTVTYDKILELYFQDPDFGFYFLKLTSERLLQNIARLEGIVERQKEQLVAAGLRPVN
ncbi:MAG: Crp/Fnr family transcriptional regulator [Pseudorhodoplanes sp.]|nr:Crp/Fnr family transcriptional regulator [Pseudorhodoplanes sp.]